MIAVKDCYTLTEIKLPDNPAEIIWGKVALHCGSHLILGSYYRTPSGHAVTQQTEFDASLQNLKKHSKINDTIVIGGDFNFKDVDWDTESVPPGAYERAASEMLIDTLNEHGLSQLQRDPTREDSVLDLYITNRSTLVQTTNNIPNISDHEGAILVDSNIKPMYTKKKPHKYHLMSKADWPAMKEDIVTFRTPFLQEFQNTDIDENLKSVKNVLHETIEKRIPSQTSSTKKNILGFLLQLD